MKTILCPTDFSSNAEQALKFASLIAAKNGAKLILLNVFWIPVYDDGTPPEVKAKEENLRQESLTTLSDAERKVKTEYPSLSISTLTLNGFTADSIVKVADEHNVDLIVMGTKGASGLVEVVMGSNTVDVINKCNCPLLAVPMSTHKIKFNQIVFASNFSESDIEEITFVTDFGKLFDSEITIAHVTEDDFIMETSSKVMLEQFKKQVKAKTNYSKLKYELLKGNDTIGTLKNFNKENEVDLLAMVTSKKNFVNKFFNRSNTQKMAHNLNTPLLVLRISERG